MKQLSIIVSGMAVMSLALTGCIDNNYDLSNLDATSRIPVDGLTVPINLEPVTFGDVLKFDDDSRVQPVTINGKTFYALQQTGEFSTDPIDIPAVTAPKADIQPSHVELEIKYPDLPAGAPVSNETVQLVWPVEGAGSEFTYSASDIDSSIEELDYLDTETFKFGMGIKFKAGQGISNTYITDMKIQAPAGLEATPSIGDYQSETGIWKIDKLEFKGDETEVWLKITGLNLKASGAKFEWADNNRSTMSFSGLYRILTAEVHVDANLSQRPTHADLDITYNLEQFDATAFSGRIHYKIEDTTIPAVQLDGIPDFLKGDDTNLSLANPQIYLCTNNPLHESIKLMNATLELSANRENGVAAQVFPSAVIPVKSDHGAGPYNFVLAQKDDNLTIPMEPVDFNVNRTFVAYPDLGRLLTMKDENAAPKGLPTSIDIRLVNTQIPSQKVDNFQLKPIDGIKGYYDLMVPFALCDGSQIYYSDRRDGWNDDGSFDDVAMQEITITAKASNDAPVAVKLHVTPFGMDGKEFDGVECTDLELGSGQAKEIVFSIKATKEPIKKLDGIVFGATVLGTKNQNPLSPDQTIRLDDLKLKFSGYYESIDEDYEKYYKN